MRTHTNQLAISLLCLLVFSLGTFASTGQTCSSSATGNLEIIPFRGKIFPTPRKFANLVTALGYRAFANRHRQYPVLYLNDGQDLFDVCTSLFHQEEWRVDETVDALIASGKIPPIIVIGIDNAGKRLRPREYLPFVDDTLTPPEPNPMGRLYPSFLLDEVLPFVENHYRVLRGARNRVLGGSSYGAGIAFFTVMQRQGSFRGLLLESPSIYADNYHLLNDAGSIRKWPDRIYLGTGTIDEPLDDVKKLKTLFERAGFDHEHLHVVVQQGGKHSEKWWAERLPEAIQFLFAKSI